MANFIDHIFIKNFKSLLECEITGCRRINLFIGRPNVGKSNIIEALSLFSIGYLKENNSKKLSNLVRLENETELFYKGNWESESYINTSIGNCRIEFNPKETLRIFIDADQQTYGAKVDSKLNVSALHTKNYIAPSIKKYVFRPEITYKKGHSKYLIPPFGNNLLAIIENYSQLKKQVKDFFREYGLEIAFDKASQSIKVFHAKKDEIFLIPYNSVADTLQRIIFYKAAIISNTDSVLLFEEPEAHSFPPYMAHLTQEMIYKRDNQYFVATHSPFILNDLLENAKDELSVFNVDFVNGQTKVIQLTRSELHEILQNGVDIFTNNEAYL